MANLVDGEPGTVRPSTLYWDPEADDGEPQTPPALADALLKASRRPMIVVLTRLEAASLSAQGINPDDALASITNMTGTPGAIR